MVATTEPAVELEGVDVAEVSKLAALAVLMSELVRVDVPQAVRARLAQAARLSWRKDRRGMDGQIRVV